MFKQLCEECTFSLESNDVSEFRKEDKLPQVFDELFTPITLFIQLFPLFLLRNRNNVEIIQYHSVCIVSIGVSENCYFLLIIDNLVSFLMYFHLYDS